MSGICSWSAHYAVDVSVDSAGKVFQLRVSDVLKLANLARPLTIFQLPGSVGPLTGKSENGDLLKSAFDLFILAGHESQGLKDLNQRTGLGGSGHAWRPVVTRSMAPPRPYCPRLPKLCNCRYRKSHWLPRIRSRPDLDGRPLCSIVASNSDIPVPFPIPAMQLPLRLPCPRILLAQGSFP